MSELRIWLIFSCVLWSTSLGARSNYILDDSQSLMEYFVDMFDS